MKYEIKRINSTRIDFLKNLVIDSKNEGLNFVANTVYEWNSGDNNFSKNGEAFYGVFDNDECVGIGGINIDPYDSNSKLGRIRHLYVAVNYRKQGIGRLILNEIIKNAKLYFQEIRLYTDNIIASKFYESIGFEKSSKYKESHIKRL